MVQIIRSRHSSGLFYFCTVVTKFTLGKNERLKSRKQIELLFKEGAKLHVPSFRIVYHFTSISTEALLFGIGVSNKNFKHAVDRNKIKRWTREAWRLNKNGLTEKLLEQRKQLSVFFIYTGKEMPDYSFITEQINQAIKKLIKLF